MLPMKVLCTGPISIGHGRIDYRMVKDNRSPASPSGTEYAVAHS